ncbi:hypothetical protein BpHYR1_045812 [Brachionus plicatilis]|uniref:Uncharacterized protein n=1 Tax=Brachionus plicatilis TaxID=10195 RepID=A0A3M7SZ11_BRAPC|nr:hypothetical protein BpHYR1_045812 [Brachionus plicatilis]
METLDQNGHLKLNIDSNQTIPEGFILVPKISETESSSKTNYEVFLPIVFIILFMTLLFFIYALKNLNLKNHFEKCCCFLFRRKRPQQFPPMARIGFQNGATQPGVYLRQPNFNNYEDHASYYPMPSSDFYANYNCHNYEQIYPAYANPNGIITVHNNYKINQFYSSESSSDYDPNTIDDQFDNKFYFNDSKFVNSNFQNRTQNYYHMGNVRSEAKRLRPIGTELEVPKTRKSIVRPVKRRSVRRSYSISRVDPNKWRKQLEKRHKTNLVGNWPTKIMSEYELKKFLIQENMLKTQTAQILRTNCSESFFQLNKSRSNALNQIYAHKNDESLHNNMNSLTQDESTLNSQMESSEVLNSTENRKKYSMTKSYSGLLSKELSVFSSIDLNKSLNNKNDAKSESMVKKNESICQNFSSMVLNISEINDSDKSKKKLRDSIRHRSSTIKALNQQESIKKNRENTLKKLGNKLKDLSNEGSLIKSICKEIKNATSVDKDLNKKGRKYSRLCKSFTFLSQRVSENIRLKKGNFYEHKKFDDGQVFVSEPTKLGSMSFLPISFKLGQINYLKNINLLKSKGFQSMNSILEIIEPVAKRKKSLNSTQTTNESLLMTEKISSQKSKEYCDAAVQTSIVTSNESSSFSSHVTTLMHSNNFGSILANFGSASIQFSQNNIYARRLRMRAYSDGNGLSDSSRQTNSSNAKNSSSFGTHSASSSKLNQLKIQI